MRTRLQRVPVAFAVFALLALSGLALSMGRANRATPEEHALLVRGRRIAVEIADSVPLRTQGLSGRERLPADAGMLFVFSKPGRHGMWMKGMRFPLDVIWLEETTPALADSGTPLKRGRGEKALRIVDMREQLATSSYPETFYPQAEAQYVLEVNARAAERYQLKTGDAISLQGLAL